MFTVYFDDSGGKDTDTIVVAGFVAPVLQWEKFKHEWNGVLSDPDYGLPPGTIFHMSEFAHSKRAFEVFANHQKDENINFQRKRFIERLVAFTRIRATMSFSCSFRLNDYEEANKQYVLREAFGGPFSFAGRTCAGKVRQWAESKNINISNIEFIFEDGMQGKGNWQEVMERDGFLMPTFRPKSKEWPPLQAADLIAWEFHKHMKLAFDQDLSGFRGSFEALQQIPGDHGVFSSLDDLLSKCIVPLGISARS